MDIIHFLLDFILHIDSHLIQIVSDYKNWTYLILFLIIFCETGLVVTPFLPGDSLLFAAGALAAQQGSSLSFTLLLATMSLAAITGDSMNYQIGRFFGPKVFSKNYWFLNKEHLIKTEKFFEKHGGKTIVYARFIPIIRTFAPFIAGVGSMTYRRFIVFNIAGGIIWVLGFLTIGYLFGNLPAVKTNFTLVILGIIAVSLIPVFIGLIRKKSV